MKQILSYRSLTDDALASILPQLARSERRASAHLVSALMEFERRSLHLVLGHTSMFDYCIKALHLTEHEAYNRIEAAKAARRFDGILEKLSAGDLSLTAIRLLAPHLTHENSDSVLEQARHKTKREIEMLIARLKPQPPVPSLIRKLPDPKPSAVTEAPPSVGELIATGPRPEAPLSRRPIVAPLSESHYKLQVTISAGARERLTQIQGLMRHRLPNGDPAAIVEHALEVLHAQLLKEKAADVARPRQGKAASEAKGRYIPASIRREVWRRDQGRCAFIAPDGRKCGSNDGVEFHHVQPYAMGGEATATNLEMRCRAHNGFEWQRHVEEETLNLISVERTAAMQRPTTP